MVYWWKYELFQFWRSPWSIQLYCRDLFAREMKRVTKTLVWTLYRLSKRKLCIEQLFCTFFEKMRQSTPFNKTINLLLLFVQYVLKSKRKYSLLWVFLLMHKAAFSIHDLRSNDSSTWLSKHKNLYVSLDSVSLKLVL